MIVAEVHKIVTELEKGQQAEEEEYGHFIGFLMLQDGRTVRVFERASVLERVD